MVGNLNAGAGFLKASAPVKVDLDDELWMHGLDFVLERASSPTVLAVNRLDFSTPLIVMKIKTPPLMPNDVLRLVWDDH